ncbi:MAG: ethanolamine utilization protein EutJ [Anaerolineales bacterium]|nr:ethanolamine utilization protein EutJ [Anaerolineales bacterium]
MQSPELRDILTRAARVFHWAEDPEPPPFDQVPTGNLRVGVDLGTAYLTVAVLDDQNQPLTGEYRFAQVARDGLVVDFVGAVDLVKSMKTQIEKRIGRELTHAASGFPPGVPGAEVQATAHVIEAAGMICTGLVDEPSAANTLVKMANGVIVDVGGGTTGIAVVENGEVVYTADEATGGTHFSLVIAGAHDIPFEDAERLKINPAEQPSLFPVVKPVLEKVASIVARHIEGYQVPEIALVGGTSAFYRAAEVIEEYTGIPSWVPDYPALVTPIGMALHDNKMETS